MRKLINDSIANFIILCSLVGLPLMYNGYHLRLLNDEVRTLQKLDSIDKSDSSRYVYFYQSEQVNGKNMIKAIKVKK